MKLNENTRPLFLGEALTKGHYHAEACKARFEGRIAEANKYLALLDSEDGDHWFSAMRFFAETAAFEGDFVEAERLAEILYDKHFEEQKAIKLLMLTLCYRGKYSEALVLLDSLEEFFTRDDYQAACIFAGIGDFAAALGRMLTFFKETPEEAESCLGRIWDDVELRSMWRALPAIALEPEVRPLLRDLLWEALLEEFEPHRGFEDFDPLNVAEIPSHLRRFVVIDPRNLSGSVSGVEAARHPQEFSELAQMLNENRIWSWSGLNTARTIVRSSDFQEHLNQDERSDGDSASS